MYKIVSKWIPKNSHILDLGCGDGSMLYELKKELNVNGLGVDISEENIQLSLAKSLNVIEQDIDLGLSNFEDQSFDLVLMSQSIQALKRPDLALSEIIRIGKECIVSIPNFANLKCRLQLFITGKMPVSSALPHSWYSTPNLHLCSLKDFETLCLDSNIAISKKKTYQGVRRKHFFIQSFS